MSSAVRVIAAGCGQRLTQAIGVLAGRLARLLSRLSEQPNETLGQGQNFLWSCFEAVAEGAPLESWNGNAFTFLRDRTPHPIDRLATRFNFEDLEVDLLLLAAMADEH